MKFAFNLYSIASLIVANLIPLYGVWFWGWKVFFLMLLYWLESAIIGGFTLLKMRQAQGGEQNSSDFSARAFFIPFFLVHYGLFMFVHLIFILIFFWSSSIAWGGLLLSFLSLLLSHFISYRTNFIDGKEYLKVSPDQLFVSPYPRIIIMHLTIILGGWLALSTGQPVWALGLMVILKTLVDLGAHMIQHKAIKAIVLT